MSHSTFPPSRQQAAEPLAIRLFGRLVGYATTLGIAISAASVLISLALISYAVLMRYVFNSAPTWVDDTVGFMLVGTVMFAAPATMRQGGHIAVDMLTGQLGPRGRFWVDVWSSLAMVAVSLIFMVNGWETALSSRMLGISTSGNVEMPIFWLQLMLPLGGALMLLVALEALLRLAAGLPSLAQRSHGPHTAGDEK